MSGSAPPGTAWLRENVSGGSLPGGGGQARPATVSWDEASGVLPLGRTEVSPGPQGLRAGWYLSNTGPSREPDLPPTVSPAGSAGTPCCRPRPVPRGAGPPAVSSHVASHPPARYWRTAACSAGRLSGDRSRTTDWGPRLLGTAAFIAGRARAPQRALTKGGRILQNVFVLSLNSHVRPEGDGSQAAGGCTATPASLLSSPVHLTTPQLQAGPQVGGNRVPLALPHHQRRKHPADGRPGGGGVSDPEKPQNWRGG